MKTDHLTDDAYARVWQAVLAGIDPEQTSREYSTKDAEFAQWATFNLIAMVAPAEPWDVNVMHTFRHNVLPSPSKPLPWDVNNPHESWCSFLWDPGVVQGMMKYAGSPYRVNVGNTIGAMLAIGVQLNEMKHSFALTRELAEQCFNDCFVEPGAHMPEESRKNAFYVSKIIVTHEMWRVHSSKVWRTMPSFLELSADHDDHRATFVFDHRVQSRRVVLEVPL